MGDIAQDVKAAFMSGEFSVHRRMGTFNEIWSDLHGLCHVLDPAEHAEQTFMYSFSKHLEKHNNHDKL